MIADIAVLKAQAFEKIQRSSSDNSADVEPQGVHALSPDLTSCDKGLAVGAYGALLTFMLSVGVVCTCGPGEVLTLGADTPLCVIGIAAVASAVGTVATPAALCL